MTSDASNAVHQPVKRTGPIPQRRKGPSRAVSAIPHPNPSVARTPLDLQPVGEILNLDTADDTDSIYQYPASEARTPALAPPTGARKRSVRVLGKLGDS